MVSSRSSLLTLALLLAWAPIPFASQRPWGVYLLAAMTFLALAVALSVASRSDFERLSASRLPLAMLSIAPLLCLVTAMPWPFLERLLGRETFSLSPFDTVRQGFRYAALVSVFVLTILSVRRRVYLFAVLSLIVFVGVFQSLYGSFMTLSGIEYSFFTPKYAGIGNATGTFINANHFAGFLMICLSVAFGMVLAHRPKGGAVVLSLVSPIMLVRVAIALIVMGVLLSSSRSANVIMIVSVVGLIGLEALLNPVRRVKLAWLLLIFLVFDLVVVGYWFGFKEVADSVVTVDVSEESRWVVFQSVVQMILQYWFVGVGAGAFDIVFTAFNPLEKPLRFVHAHNDYLQVWAEFGVFGFIALVAFFAFTFSKAFSTVKSTDSWRVKATAYSVIMMLMWFSLHSLVDFNFQITANAYYLVVICALLWTSSHFSKRIERS